MSILLMSCQEPSGELINLNLNPGVDTIELGSSYNDPGAYAKYGVIDLDVTVVSDNLDTNTLGTYEIIYEASYQTFVKRVKRVLIVVDTTPPLLTLNPGVDTIKVGDTWVDEGVTAQDMSEGIVITVTGEVLDEVGTYIMTYHATDIHGNESLLERVVHVIE